jgi:hypothetical protein
VKGSGAGNALSTQANNYASVILPAADIMKAASQAPAAAAEKKDK